MKKIIKYSLYFGYASAVIYIYREIDMSGIEWWMGLKLIGDRSVNIDRSSSIINAILFISHMPSKYSFRINLFRFLLSKVTCQDILIFAM